MARRKQVIIDIKKLECREQLLQELQERNRSNEWDLNSFRVVGVYKYKPRKQDIEHMIERVKWYNAQNINDDVIFTKRDLSAMLQISRPTLDKLINSDIIDDGALRNYEGAWKLSELLIVLEEYLNKSNYLHS